MALIPEPTAFQKALEALPLATFPAGESVFADGSRTGRLLILKKGSVTVSKGAVEIARVKEPGAVFGELSVLLDKSHSADVRTLETSQFYAADATALLSQNPIALLYVATILARRLDGTNQALVELKTQLQASQPADVVGKTIEKMEKLLGASGASLAYAGYPYDPFA